MPMRRSPRSAASLSAEVTASRASAANCSNMVVSLPVLGVHGLSGDAEGVADLFPGPSLFPGPYDCCRFDLLGQSVQGTHGPQPHCRVVRSEAL